MLLVEKSSNVLGDMKKELVTTPLLEKKSLIKDVDKGTDELEDMKRAMVTILRKGLYTFEVKSKGSTAWLNLIVNLK